MAHFPFNFQMCSLKQKRGFNPQNLRGIIEDYVKVLTKKSWPNWQVYFQSINKSYKILK